MIHTSIKFITCCTLFSLGFADMSPDVCRFYVKITQSLLNEGFHRKISYDVEFNEASHVPSMLYQDCMLAVDQKLPPGVYINPDEIADLKRLGKVNIMTTSRVNVELPAEQSEAIRATVLGQVRGASAHLWMPVHARYHAAKAGGGEARNEIPPPRAFLHCPDRRLEKCDGYKITWYCEDLTAKHCKWKEIYDDMTSEPLVWSVPVGNLDHYHLVVVVTSLSAAVAAIYLLAIIHHAKVALSCRAKTSKLVQL